MSDENTDIFGDDYEEGEIIDENNEEESEEQKEDDEDDDEGWGGSVPHNEIIIPNMNVMATLFGIHPIIAPRLPLEEDLSPGPLLTPNPPRIRRREEVCIQPSSVKSFRNISGKRIIRERTPLYSYLALKNGEEFYFTEEDGKNILLNERIEVSRLIRNIISKMPFKMSERLLYLAKFESDEESDEENMEKVQKRYIGNLKELVYRAYIKEWRLRFAFKRLLIGWRMYKMNKSCEKEVDPITLSDPEKEIYIYDWDNKKKFVFDAKSMATNIESKLMYHEYGFPSPLYPRNPKNNVEFSYKQMVSLYYQLKFHGELRWGFTTLREYNFNKHRWHMYHKSALTINSIKSNISLLDSSDGRELLLDFIFAKMDELGFQHNTAIFNMYNTAMIHLPTHWYIEKLKSLAVLHYEAEHFGYNKIRIINTGCLKIFKLHNKFINDLKNKKIIN